MIIKITSIIVMEAPSRGLIFRHPAAVPAERHIPTKRYQSSMKSESETVYLEREKTIKLEETLNEIDKFQMKIRDNMLEWMKNLKRMEGLEAATEEEASLRPVLL
jgi:hypothetical protein